MHEHWKTRDTKMAYSCCFLHFICKYILTERYKTEDYLATKNGSVKDMHEAFQGSR